MRAYIDADVLICHLRGDVQALDFLKRVRDDRANVMMDKCNAAHRSSSSCARKRRMLHSYSCRNSKLPWWIKASSTRRHLFTDDGIRAMGSISMMPFWRPLQFSQAVKFIA